ncbi:hypothetical protein AMTRI_Chr02g213400 [Amborella trichopoda]|uniref:Lecithin-cholesterol acyltransferase-like 4 n=1 Tax=Amborella trichopoda TaxID=13333 RepID=U5D0I9_AMBTC|nr:lecithin-cholesterol acyltransferase-like 4 [Amborella trichopoda]XP_020528367.1 lecithin-cholesterol acyltransferase-like 4 [Amborella trichopoda]ERN14907.1 hypothetical protein AMTR_s00032p00177900 [Amborella trichopoda]|eukprot:XP_006853440.1 lecithin-cholesterol acyltransferase-like 4 [Amborella trichopoda]
MAMILEEILESIEVWLHVIKKKQQYVNPNLDPVLLVPGIAGSILTAVDGKGHEERVWVRLLAADRKFRTKMWSRFDPSSGKTLSLDPETRVVVPEDRFGLYSCDVLDPDMIIGKDSVCYFHDMIEEMISWGFQEGETLFGFGYDFRQSNRLQETFDRFTAKLESIYKCSEGKKVTIISHSMGGLLVKCFMCLHKDVFEKYVKNWIAIAAPFQGAPGYITDTLLNGISFVEGWEQSLFISKWSMHQLLIECPSIYELMGCPDFDWSTPPLLQIWRERSDSSSNSVVKLESYDLRESISIIEEALADNKIQYDGVDLHLPFNREIFKWANKTREIMSSAKLPSTVKFYNIYGTCNDTPLSVRYGSMETPISDLKQLVPCEPDYICVDGDGTVPVESAMADGLKAEARIAVPGDHRGLVCDPHVFRIIKHYLKIGYPDPYYNPINDYVILPTSTEYAKLDEDGLQITAVKEHWEFISGDDENSKDATNETSIHASVSVGHVGNDHSREEAHATVTVHPQDSQGKKHVEVRAIGMSVC